MLMHAYCSELLCHECIVKQHSWVMICIVLLNFVSTLQLLNSLHIKGVNLIAVNDLKSKSLLYSPEAVILVDEKRFGNETKTRLRTTKSPSGLYVMFVRNSPDITQSVNRRRDTVRI